MQVDLGIAHVLYEESKFWLAAGAFFFSVFRGIDWLKKLKTNDLHHIQLSCDSLHEELKQQTSSIVQAVETGTAEMKELRADLRTFTSVFSKPVSKRRRTRARPR